MATALLFECELVLRSFLTGPTLKLEPLDNKRLLSRCFRRFASSDGMLSLAGGFTPTTMPGMHRLGGLAFTQTGLNYKTGMILGSPFIAIHNGLRTGAFLLSIGQRALECHNPHFISGSGFRRGGRLGAR